MPRLAAFHSSNAAYQTLDVMENDPSDNRILECAKAAGSDYVVTGHNDLSRLGKYADIQIVKVSDFLHRGPVSRAMIRIVATVALVLAISSTALAESFEGRVVAITDGDTIRVLRDGEQVRVRLHGIDAPEKKQAFGTRARQYAGELAHEKLVRVEVKNLDRNGRTVGVVILPDGPESKS